jgi:uncharacterized membrane protein
MAVVLYAALDLAALHAALTRGSMSALGLFFGLTLVMPLFVFFILIFWWLVRHFGPNTLF